MIIGLLGQAQAGKDTVGDYLCEHYNFKKKSFAKALKLLCIDLFNLTLHQLNTNEGKSAIDPRYNMTPRRILQKVGTGMREIYDNIWIDALFTHDVITKHKLGLLGNVVITDVRFLNEVKAIKKVGGKVIRLIREDYKVLEGKEADHSSETEQLTIPEDLIDLTLSAKTGEVQKLYDGINVYLESAYYYKKENKSIITGRKVKIQSRNNTRSPYDLSKQKTKIRR